VASTKAKAKKASSRSRAVKRAARASGMRPAASVSAGPAPASSGESAPRRLSPPGGAAARGKYVYCVVESSSPLRFGPLGIGTELAEVNSVHYKERAAIVSDTPVEVFDATCENVLAHEQVNEAVMREHTVIPMSFGTVFKTRGDIVELLRAAYDAFGDVLQKMKDKVEFGLKVLWDRDAVVREIEAEDEDVRRLKDETFVNIRLKLERAQEAK
jgi:hypothetical protein